MFVQCVKIWLTSLIESAAERLGYVLKEEQRKVVSSFVSGENKYYYTMALILISYIHYYQGCQVGLSIFWIKSSCFKFFLSI